MTWVKTKQVIATRFAKRKTHKNDGHYTNAMGEHGRAKKTQGPV